MPAIARFGILLVVEGDDVDVIGVVADLDAALLVPCAASVCIERTFEVPQAAAGPLVTPTKPIFSSLFAANAGAQSPIERTLVATAPSMVDRKTDRLLIMSPLPFFGAARRYAGCFFA